LRLARSRARLLTWLLAHLLVRFLTFLRTSFLSRFLARLAGASLLATTGIASLRPISISRAGSISTTCSGSIAIARRRPIAITCSWPVTIAYSGPVTIISTRASAIGLEYLLAVLSAELLPRRLPDVCLREFLPHIGVVVPHALTVIRVVLPPASVDIGDVGGSIGNHVDIAAPPIAVAPEGMAHGDTGRECDARCEYAACEVPRRRRKIVRRIVGIWPIPIDRSGLVVRNVDFVRRSRLDHDVLLLVFRFHRDRLLLR